MTRNDIIKLARESGNVVFSEALVFGWAEVERFVALVEQRAAAAEREACREIAFRMAHSDEDAVDVSHAIRARGET